jgi:tetratricopeptide (TPR) repeat protein
MAEPVEEAESGSPESAAQESPAAVAIALGRTSRGPGSKAVDAEAVAFLRDQRRLINIQTEHLHEQRELTLSRLRWGRFNDRIKGLLQVMTAVVGLAVGVGVGAMAWQAHEDHGVAIAAFTVPPDFAQKGLTGQVVASQVLDRLSDLQEKTVTARPASTYANDWGGDIKVEIPETGVSLGELNRYLREWLGHETRISGEVVRTDKGVAVTARVGAASGKRFEGAEADLDKLVGQAAEAVYAQTQPYRFAVYLQSSGRRDEALAAYRKLAKSGAPEDRAWAYSGWATLESLDNHLIETVRLADEAIRLDPKLYPAYVIRNGVMDTLGWHQAELDTARQELALHRRGAFVGLSKEADTARQTFLRGVEAMSLGDYSTAVALIRSQAGATIDFEGIADAYTPTTFLGVVLARNHDVTGSRQVTQGMPNMISSQVEQHLALGEWRAVKSMVDQVKSEPRLGDVRSTAYAEIAGLVDAHLGRFAEAEALLASSRTDCDDCVIARGQVAAMRRDWAAAGRWFAEVERRAPSLPLADTQWAAALLDKGDPDAAIAKAAEAHRRGPHFADPLHVWGEALTAKRDFAGAIAKFAEADQYAPKWGRNHLRWGEALMLQGRYREARAQYEAASGLDLTQPDRAALDVLLARTAAGRLHG